MLYSSIIWQSDNRLEWEENQIILALNRKSHLKIQLLSCLVSVLHFNEKQALRCQSASLDTISILCDQMRTLNLILMFWELIFNIYGVIDLSTFPILLLGKGKNISASVLSHFYPQMLQYWYISNLGINLLKLHQWIPITLRM